MDELKFKVSSGLKSILGQDLITSDNIAIYELVKNSYDAHATKVLITFEDNSITISDNGKGMSFEELKNKWLIVGYSAKSDGTEDASYRSKIKRNFAGAKGIGRISCDRLGSEVTLTTKSALSDHVERIHVDWSRFEESMKQEFDQVLIDHEVVEGDYVFPEGSLTGTELKISGFRSINLIWNRERIFELRRSLEKMINPFSDAEDFSIEISVPRLLEEDKKLMGNLQSSGEQNTVKETSSRTTKKIVNGIIQNTISNVLNIKTTVIESSLKNDVIVTKLLDRGELMYEIQEVNKYLQLEDVTINLYYLNKVAKQMFTSRMGIPPVQYGNVMLFRNGFRVWPYGEPKDDSWKLNERAQQGYNRFLGTRDLFGRVDVETSDVSAFKEVSSRDGGLIMTEAASELMDYFAKIHRRLERYVAGVLWGEGFLRNAYFKNNELAREARDMLKHKDKESESSRTLFENVGSKVDFLQLIKSLVNDKNIVVNYYNHKLADVVSDVSYAEILQNDFIDSIKEVAKKTSDEALADNIAFFEKSLAEMRKRKEEAEEQARIEKQKAIEEAKKRKVAEEARRKAESELAVRKKQNLFLLSVGSLDTDRILKYHHDIRIHSATIHNTIGQMLRKLNKGMLSKDEIIKLVERIARANDKVISIAQFATKANYNIDTDDIEADIISYIEEYVNRVLPEFYGDMKLKCESLSCSKVLRFAPIEASIFVDNLISNAVKANATHFDIKIAKLGDGIRMLVSDDGDGLSPDITDPNSILDKGVTTTNGSGLGLYNVLTFVHDVLHGTIKVVTVGDSKGFKLEIIF